jgi:hypothetical protein
MDLGYEKGLIEANRLHVETYASLDAIEGPRALPKNASRCGRENRGFVPA